MLTIGMLTKKADNDIGCEEIIPSYMRKMK